MIIKFTSPMAHVVPIVHGRDNSATAFQLSVRIKVILSTMESLRILRPLRTIAVGKTSSVVAADNQNIRQDVAHKWQHNP